MKIIHTGDFHLDSALKAHLSADAAKIRKQELFEAFSRLIDYANEHEIKVVLLAGDVFDSNKVSKNSKSSFLKIISKNSHIDFIYTLGNHDENSIVFEEIPENLFVGSNFWQSKEYEDVSINYINFNSNSEKILYNTLKLANNKKNIVVLHGESTQYREVGKIHLSELVNKNIDYLALGHIHQNSLSNLDDRGVFAYCGCLEGRGFDEEGEKGFYVIDTDDIKNPKFVVNSKRIIYKKDISIEGSDHWLDYEEKVKKELKGIPEKDMVEVIITGKYKIELIKRIDDLLNYLNERFFLAKVKDISKLAINLKDYENSPTFKNQFIKMVMNSSDFSEDERKEIIEVGIHALTGDEF